MRSHESDTPDLRDEVVVRTMFARLSAADYDSMAELFADDIEFDLAYAHPGADGETLVAEYHDTEAAAAALS
jgi:ketosteroid isomerase-like protein